MTSRLEALCFAAQDPLRLARFWGGVLGREPADDSHDAFSLPPSDEAGLRIRFLPSRQLKSGQNHMHLDLTSTSLDDQEATVARALGHGARHIDVGQRPEEGHV